MIKVICEPSALAFWLDKWIVKKPLIPGSEELGGASQPGFGFRHRPELWRIQLP